MWLAAPIIGVLLLHVFCYAMVFGRVVDTVDSNRRIAARVPRDRFEFSWWIFTSGHKQLKDPLVSALIWPLRATSVLFTLLFLILLGGVFLRFVVHRFH